MRRSTFIAAALVVALGCKADTTASPADGVELGKGGGTQPPPDWIQVDVTDAGMGITSDGRGAYVGGTCGVHADILSSGDGAFYPYRTSPASSQPCGDPRYVNVDLGALGVRTFFFTNVLGLNAVTGTSDQIMAFDMNGDTRTCERLWYNTEVGSLVRVTFNGTDGLGRRNWTVQSLAPHSAGCYVKSGRTLKWDGTTRTIPFSWTITELAP